MRGLQEKYYKLIKLIHYVVQSNCKNNLISNDVRLVKGMSVEVASQTSNVWGDLKGKELVRIAFIAKYRIDMKKACAINSVHLDVQRIH